MDLSGKENNNYETKSPAHYFSLPRNQVNTLLHYGNGYKQPQTISMTTIYAWNKNRKKGTLMKKGAVNRRIESGRACAHIAMQRFGLA